MEPWRATSESQDDDEEEDHESWYNPPKLDLQESEDTDSTIRVDSVVGLTYRGQLFTNNISDDDPLRTRLEQWTKPSTQMVNAVEEEEVVYDGLDNLTYREDSLSIIRGMVTTRLGEGLPIWILTDSGAMTQLIQKDYAQRMKFSMENIPPSQQFNISGPGGGRGQVTQRVIMDVSFNAFPITGDDSAGSQSSGDTTIITIKMSFGVVENLPVPVLWGGKQMRNLECHDLHEHKLLTCKWENQRYSLPTTSWLTACLPMQECKDTRVTKALKHLMPTRSGMVNMAAGIRHTTNVGTALYPGKGNIVRVARHQARVDEGTNQVDIANEREIAEEFGNMITCTPCVNHGEAFLVVYNNTERALYLSGGKLKLTVTPILNLPICSTASTEFQRLKTQHSVRPTEPQKARLPTPRSFVTWSCDGLTDIITSGDLNAFYREIKEFTPDVIAIQQVKWKAHPEDHTSILPNSEDETNYQLLVEALAPHYRIYLNLSPKAYGGQMLLVHNNCQAPEEISYHLAPAAPPAGSGRVVTLHYPNLEIWSVWAPTLGKKDAKRLARREKWDKALWEALAQNSHRSRVVMGNFQAVLEDHHMAGPSDFWLKQGQDVNQLGLHDTSQDIGDEGYPTTTANERMRFNEGILSANLVDPQRNRSPLKTQFTWQDSKLHHQLVTTYTLVSSDIYKAGGVEANTTIEPINTSDPYLGSEHRPKWLSLKQDWESRKEKVKSERIEEVTDLGTEGEEKEINT